MNLFGGWLVLTTCINAGGCNRKMRISGYVRKHNPFISFRNIQNDWRRCSKIVNSIQLDRDIVSDMVPQYVFYTPDVRRTRRHLSLFSHRHYQPIKKTVDQEWRTWHRRLLCVAMAETVLGFTDVQPSFYKEHTVRRYIWRRWQQHRPKSRIHGRIWTWYQVVIYCTWKWQVLQSLFIVANHRR